jgi:16S rRNA (adenine1518-N6/adenine1519-N6)-dimethyltransferase
MPLVPNSESDQHDRGPVSRVTELDPQRLSAEGVARYLRKHDLAASKRKSQNHLVDGDVLEQIVELANVSDGRRVLEIGPGLGILTGALLQAGANVTAVELDQRLVGHLRDRFASLDPKPERLKVIEGSILDFRIAELMQPPYDVVANLPYHITSPVLHQILGEEPRPERFVLMVQREVAERIAAPPGEMSYLSVFVQYHAQVRVALVVPPSSFEPAPAVQSAVLVGEVRARRLSPD